MSVYTDQLAAISRTKQDLLVVGVRYCTNFYASEAVLGAGGQQGVRWTEDFSNVLWSKTNATITTDTYAAPDGTTTADTIDYTAATGTVLSSCDFSLTNAIGDVFTGSVWLRTAAGTGTATIRLDRLAGTDTIDSQVTVTTTWTRFSVSLAQTVAGSIMRFVIVRVAGDAAQVIAWGANCTKIGVAYPPPSSGHVFPYRKREAELIYSASVMTSPCQAVDAGDGARCFYSFPTCQDPINFRTGNSWEATAALQGIREFKFCRKDSPLALPGEDIRPQLTQIAQSAQEIDPTKSVTMNERVSLALEDDAGPGLWDAVKSTDGAKVNTAAGAGSFWRRFLAIFKNYANPAGYVIWKTGFAAAGMTEALYQQRGKYLIRNLLVGSNGMATIECADRLKLLRKSLPSQISDTNLLNGAINSAVTSVIVDDASEVTPVPTDGAYNVVILMGTEKCNVTAIDTTTNTLTIQRGRWGTTAATHSDNSAFSEVVEFGTELVAPSSTPAGINPIDIVYQLLRMGGIDAVDIDTTTLYAERDLWIPSTVNTTTGAMTGTAFRRSLTEKTDVETLLREVREVSLLSLWVGEDQRVTGRIFAPARPSETLTDLTDNENFVKDSVNVNDNDELTRVSRVIVGYNLTAGESADELKNYTQRTVRIGATEESDGEYGEARTNLILSQWIRPSDSATANRLTIRLLTRYRNGARIVSGTLALKDDASVACGSFVTVSTAKLQTAFGATAASRVMQVTKKSRKANGDFDIDMLDTGLLKRYCFITPAGYPDYDSASAAQKRYGFIGNASNRVGTLKVDGYYLW